MKREVSSPRANKTEKHTIASLDVIRHTHTTRQLDGINHVYTSGAHVQLWPSSSGDGTMCGVSRQWRAMFEESEGHPHTPRRVV